MMNPELLKCPFCGCFAYMGMINSEYYISCSECGCKTKLSTSEGYIISLWNTRFTETRLKRALNNLKEDCNNRIKIAMNSYEKKFLSEMIIHIESELDYDRNKRKITEKTERNG